MSSKRYIPGLSQENYEESRTKLCRAHVESSADYKLPPKLLKEFKSGNKNPVAAVNEYCTIVGLEYAFEQQTPNSQSAMVGKGFYMACNIGGFVYPQGCGSNKKEAKKNAATMALEYIIKQGLIVADPSRNDRTLFTEFSSHKPSVSSVEEEHYDDHHSAIIDTPLGVIVRRLALEFNRDLDLSALEAGSEEEEALLREMVGLYACPRLFEMIIQRPPTHFDQICLLVHSFLSENPSICIEHDRIAAFVVMDSTREPRVVSLGCGSGLVDGGRVKGDGRVLMDCRAVVLARRALLKYLHDQLNSFISNRDSIFCHSHHNSEQFCLREDVSVHLYMSHPPSGEAYLDPSRPSSTIISKAEVDAISSTTHYPSFLHGLGALTFLEHSSVDGTASRMHSVCEADKLLMWNVVGLQGSLLSHLIEPLYLSSITIGRAFDAGQLSRDLCCRLPDHYHLPPPFFLHHPFLGRPSIYGCPSPTLISPPCPQTATRCMNWIVDSPKIEILDSSCGIATDDSPFKSSKKLASRLCKLAFCSRYSSLLKQLLGRVTPCTYRELKQEGGYALAKREVVGWMRAEGLGLWPHKGGLTDQFDVPA